MEKELEIINEDALDIMENAQGITSEQLAALQQDDRLKDDVALLHAVKECVGRKTPVDVDARLRMFHARMQGRNEEARETQDSRRPLLLLLFGIAASIIAAIFCLHTVVKDEPQVVKGMIFAAEGQREGITLTNSKGDKVTLAHSSNQSRSISLSDFREVLERVGVSEKVTLDVPYGSSADITLPDGSVVYMHPGARIVFPSRFTGEKREVIFEGEAYFKVAHDAGHPFVVTSGTLEMTVLGTEFNISTHSGRVVLVNGSVSLRETDSDAHVLLKPHQQAALSAEKTGFSVTEADVEPYEFWRDGYLYFEQAEMKEIMEAIGKNFNMSVIFRNDEALHYRMRFITQRNKGVEAAIKTMNEMGKANVSIKGNTIFVE